MMTRKFAGMHFKCELNYSTDRSRCLLAKEAIENKYTHILFLDDDMSFPHYTANRLVSHKKPIIAANYTSRVLPLKPMAVKDGERIMSKGRSGLERVDRAPTGIMLIETSVFEKLEMPWFKTEMIPPYGPDDWISDDFYFCQKAVAAGFDIWIDHDLSQQVGHVGNHIFSHSMFPADASAAKNSLTLAEEILGESAA